MTEDTIILDVFSPGSLRLGCAEYRCALGPTGIISHKHEGDGGTPAGCFPLRSVMYRSDRLTRPDTKLPCRALKESDGWCDDPSHRDYNQLISRPHPARHETLWRDDHVYDVIVEVGFNDQPPVLGKGSAIFMHIARDDYAPTEGCIALNMDDLLAVLRDCGTKTLLRVNLPG